MKKAKILAFAYLINLTFTSIVNGESKQILFAKDLMEFGQYDKAIESFLNILYQSDSDEEKALCLDNLGRIALLKKDSDLAIKTWERIMNEYPSSNLAGDVKLMVEQVKLVESLTNINTKDDDIKGRLDLAKGAKYFENAEFFKPDDISEIYVINTDYLNTREFAISWLDKVIKEFPKSGLHLKALQKKFFYLRGSQGEGINLGSGLIAYPESTGVFKGVSKYSSGDPKDFEEAINSMKKIVAEVQSNFPDQKNILCAMCYMIAREYWLKQHKDEKWPEDRSFNTGQESVKWFRIALKYAAENSFYSEYIKLRLANLGFDK